MKRKHYTKEERAKKEFLEYLSRRDFVKKGLLAGTSLAVGPRFLGKLIGETTAYAASGPAAFKFVQLNCRGGWGNAIVPLDGSSNPLTGSALGRFGVQPTILSQSGRSQSLFGVQWFDRSIDINTATEQSDFIRGLCNKITGNTDPTAFTGSLNNPGLQRIAAAGFACDSQDDNGTDPFGCNGVLGAAGFRGTLVDSIGTRNTATGMSATSVLTGAPTPFIAPNFGSINDLLAYTPALKGKPKPYLDNFANAIKNLGAIQAPKILEKATKRELALQSVDAAHTDNLRFTTPNSTDFNAILDPLFVDKFNALVFNNGTAQALTINTQLHTFATALNAMLMGQVNSIMFDLAEGYDYHGQIVADNGGALGTLSRDRLVGQHVGAVAACFLAKQQNGIILVTSDGATGGNPDHTAATIWTGDRGQQTIFQMFVVVGNPSTPMPERNSGRMQVGIMRPDTGSVDTSTFSGKGDAAAATAVAANILALNGVSPEEILRIFPSFASIGNLMSHLVFKI